MSALKTPLFSLALLTLVSVGVANAETPAIQAPSPNHQEAAENAAPAKIGEKRNERRGPKAGKDYRRVNNGVYGFMTDEEFEKFKSMSPEDRKAHLKELHEKMSKMSFEERRAQREKMIEKMRAMSPEERKAHHKKRKEWFENLPENERTDLREQMQKEREERRAAWEKMSPEEKEVFKKQREEMFKKLPPEKKERLRKQLEGKQGNKPETPSEEKPAE